MSPPVGDDDQRLRDALAALAEHAPPPSGTATADRAAARHRTRRRQQAAGGAAVLAIAAVLVAVPPAVSGLSTSPAVRADPTAGTPASLYELPVRGSLAGDAEFLAGVRAVDWTGPAGADDDLRPAEDTRRVVYAADVPGGERWALVLGRVGGGQLVHAWFTGPAGARPDQLVLTGRPTRTGTDPAITLLDGERSTGTLVVVGRPEDGAEYSPSLDRDAGGQLRRSYTPLPLVDGVPLAEVATPAVYGAGQVRVLRARADRVARDVLVPTVVGAAPSPSSGAEDVAGADPGYWLRLRDCLTPRGFEVVLDPGGTGLSWSGGPALSPDVGPPSTAEQAQNNAAFDACVAEAAG